MIRNKIWKRFHFLMFSTILYSAIEPSEAISEWTCVCCNRGIGRALPNGGTFQEWFLLSMCTLLVEHEHNFSRVCAHFLECMCTLSVVHVYTLKSEHFHFLARSFTCEKSVKLCQVTEHSRKDSYGWCMHSGACIQSHKAYFSWVCIQLQLSMCTVSLDHVDIFSWAYAHFSRACAHF